jgi:protein pelota
LVILLDDERADFGLLSDYGLDEKATIFSGKHGKQFQAEESNRYFSELLQKIEEIGLKKILVAGPGFTKGNFQKYLSEKRVGLEVSFHATNSVGKTGFSEILKKGLGVKAVEELEIVKEAKMVDEVLAELGKNSGKVAYGLVEAKKAAELGAVKLLLLAEKFFLENREELEPLMDLAEKAGGEIHILAAEHEAAKRIEELTGVVALLRYRIE